MVSDKSHKENLKLRFSRSLRIQLKIRNVSCFFFLFIPQKARICEERRSSVRGTEMAQEVIFEIFTRRNSQNGTESFDMPLHMIENDGYGPSQDRVKFLNNFSYCHNVFFGSFLNRSKGEPLLRKWLLILIGRMWDGYPAAVEHANRGNYIQNILDFVKEDEDPEVRVNTI